MSRSAGSLPNPRLLEIAQVAYKRFFWLGSGLKVVGTFWGSLSRGESYLIGVLWVCKVPVKVFYGGVQGTCKRVTGDVWSLRFKDLPGGPGQVRK